MREKWIDNLKLIAAGGVFLCHYAEAFAVEGAGITSWLKYLNQYLLALVINGEFWVCIFCILSGYLVSRKKISCFKELLKGCINRYFRFFIPFMFANLFVYAIANTIGFSSRSCGQMISNAWFMEAYISDISILDVAKHSILLGSGLNSTFWVIRHMFLASCIIYISSYLENIFKCSGIRIVVLIILLVCPYTFFIGVNYLGSIIPIIYKKIKGENKKLAVIVIVIPLFMMSGVQNVIADVFNCDILYINQYWETLYSFSIIICICASKYLKGLFNNINLSKLSNQSMTIYLLHWPILCAFSAGCFMGLLKMNYSFEFYYFITLGITIAILGIIVFIYEETIGKISNKFLKLVIIK